MKLVIRDKNAHMGWRRRSAVSVLIAIGISLLLARSWGLRRDTPAKPSCGPKHLPYEEGGSSLLYGVGRFSSPWV